MSWESHCGWKRVWINIAAGFKSSWGLRSKLKGNSAAGDEGLHWPVNEATWKQEGTSTLFLASSEMSHCGYCPTQESPTCWFTKEWLKDQSVYSPKNTAEKVPLAVKVLPPVYASFCWRVEPAPNILSVTLSICAAEEVTVWGWGEQRWARFLDSFVENRQSG